MKKKLVKSLLLAFAGSLLVAGSAMALPIAGNLNMAGGWTPLGGATISTAKGFISRAPGSWQWLEISISQDQ